MFWSAHQSIHILFLLDALTFFISFFILLQVDFHIKKDQVQHQSSPFSMIKSGLKFLFSRQNIRVLLLLLFPVAWMGKVFDVLVLELSSLIHGATFNYLGLLLSVFALGGISSSFCILKFHDRLDILALTRGSGFTLCIWLMIIGFWSIPVIIYFPIYLFVWIHPYTDCDDASNSSTRKNRASVFRTYLCIKKQKKVVHNPGE
ncbi:MFS transporter [Alkalihalobacillus sp. TS-13]|uniref:MFS transporter n=1 Tax=Alkalihalobacillus sp. TS-13 TaxID=2842455 RepID=UPI001C86B570